MTRRFLALCTALCGLTHPVLAEEVFPATLACHALIPAASFIPAPADAPMDAQVSGKFAGAARVLKPRTVPGDTVQAMASALRASPAHFSAGRPCNG